MAKKTKSPPDEVDIIRWRDGAIDATPVGSLDADSRRALADSRLRALALALKVERTSQGADDPDDTELLAYLLEMLPEQRRHEVEMAVRGNARAFGHLMSLRTAFNTQTDRRDRRRAEHPARNVPRHALPGLEVRRLGERLQFRDVRASPVSHLATEPAAFRLAEERRELARKTAPPVKRSPPQMRRAPKTGLTLRIMLGRVSEPLDDGRELVEEALDLLGQWEKLNLDSDPISAKLSPGLSERLADVLLRLQREANQLADTIRQIVFTTVEGDDLLLTERRAEFRSTPAALASYAEFASYEASYEADADLTAWSNVAIVQVGSWSLLLVGTASPSPTLIVTLRPPDTQAASELPILTLVRSNQGFETANVDSAGVSSVDLSSGRNLLLVQGEKEIWQVPLMLREG